MNNSLFNYIDEYEDYYDQTKEECPLKTPKDNWDYFYHLVNVEINTNKTKPGKAARKVLTKLAINYLEYGDDFIKNISEYYYQDLSLNISRNISDFVQAYNDCNSCMSDKGKEVYLSYPKDTYIAILKNQENKIIARCLLRYKNNKWYKQPTYGSCHFILSQILCKFGIEKNSYYGVDMGNYLRQELKNVPLFTYEEVSVRLSKFELNPVYSWADTYYKDTYYCKKKKQHCKLKHVGWITNKVNIINKYMFKPWIDN